MSAHRHVGWLLFFPVFSALFFHSIDSEINSGVIEDGNAVVVNFPQIQHVLVAQFCLY